LFFIGWNEIIGRETLFIYFWVRDMCFILLVVLFGISIWCLFMLVRLIEFYIFIVIRDNQIWLYWYFISDVIDGRVLNWIRIVVGISCFIWLLNWLIFVLLLIYNSIKNKLLLLEKCLSLFQYFQKLLFLLLWFFPEHYIDQFSNSMCCLTNYLYFIW
jgi:hypothetical protein